MSLLLTKTLRTLVLAGGVAALTACGGGGGGGGSDTPDPSPQQTYAMSGTVTGLTGTGLILQLSTGETYEVEADGEFTFPDEIPEGTTYTITVNAHPTGDTQNQVCEVENGTGTVNGEVSNIAVTCTDSQPVSGTVAGLADGATLTLQNSNGDELVVTAGGAIEFGTEVAEGADYEITVATQPTTPNQICTVANASGTVADAAITNIEITCVNSYTIGGTISGLAGSGLVIQNNGGDNISITENGDFTFATAQIDATDYAVTVLANPTVPNQTCIVTSDSGTIADADVTNVAVVCTTNKYTIGGTATGVAGSGLVLQNNAGDDLTVAENGDFTFATAIDDLSAYEVTVKTNPSTPNQTCTVTNESGNLAGGNTTSVAVNCITNKYSIGGTVTGLEGDGLVIQNNGGDDIAVSSDGSFTFETELDDMSAYAVTVLTNPTEPTQVCSAASASGFLDGDDLTSVVIECYTPIAVTIENHSRSAIASWTGKDGVSNYDLYYSTAEGVTPENCAEDPNCTKIEDVSNPITITNLKNDTVYYALVEGVNQATSVKHRSLTATAAPKEWEFGFYDSDELGSIYDMAIGSEGTLYIAGKFDKVGDYKRTCLAAINSDGTMSDWAPVIGDGISCSDSPVNIMILEDDVVYFSGPDLKKVNGTDRNYVAAVDVRGDLMGWSPALEDDDDNVFISGLQASNGKVFFGGDFDSVNDSERLNIAAVDTDGNLIEWAPSIPSDDNDFLSNLIVDDSRVYASFKYSDTTIVAYDINTAAVDWTVPTMPISSETNGLLLYGDQLIVGGDFDEVAGDDSYNGIASIDINDQTLNWGADIYNSNNIGNNSYRIWDIALSGSTIYVGGSKTNVVGIDDEVHSRSNFSVFDINGNLLPVNVPILTDGNYEQAYVFDILVYGDFIYIGGRYNSAGGKSRKSFAVINAAGEIQ